VTSPVGHRERGTWHAAPVTGRRIASTLDLRAHPPFPTRADTLRPADWRDTTPRQLLLLLRILQAAAQRRPLILYSSWGRLKPDLIALVLLGVLPARLRPPAVLVGEMWEPTPGRHRIERGIVRLADRAVDRYLVLSRAEAELLPRSWPVPAEKIRVRPFHFDPAEHGLAPTVALERGDYVFSGGDSYRDYPQLLEAARRMPDVRFLVVSTVLQDEGLPPNVELRRASYLEYVAFMRDAAAVVVPIQRGLRRSAGLLTFLMAMWLRKPTIVTDVLAVDEYVQHGRTGLLVDGSPESYERALRAVLGPTGAELADRLGRHARDDVQRRFTFAQYVDGILAELDDAVRERQA
jgi:glycosyltransferase involved in cell wall biosynthesis